MFVLHCSLPCPSSIKQFNMKHNQTVVSMAHPQTKATVMRQPPSFHLESRPSIIHARSRITVAPVAFIGSQPFTQHHNLPHHTHSNKEPDQRDQESSPQAHDPVDLQDDVQVFDTDTTMLVYRTSVELDATNTCTRRRRAAQWKHWQDEIIPRAIQPYMRLMETTASLRLPPTEPGCYDCACLDGHEITIKVVQFSTVEELTLWRCDVHHVALQLLQRGLFPCAPIVPTLAVDIKLLEFMKTLFLRVSPNVTAMSSTLEDCLYALGYKLETVVSHLRIHSWLRLTSSL